LIKEFIAYQESSRAKLPDFTLILARFFLKLKRCRLQCNNLRYVFCFLNPSFHNSNIP
jgi:hypothetical protein